MDEREIERDLAQLTLDQHAFNEQLMAKVADQGARLLIAQSTIDALRQALTHEQQRRGALEALLRQSLVWLAGYQCEDMQEGDALTAFEERIDKALTPQPTTPQAAEGEEA